MCKNILIINKFFFIFQKNKKGRDLVSAVDAKKLIQNQSDTYVSAGAQGFLEKADQVPEWQVVITEGASSPALLEGDDVNKSIGERYAALEQKGGRSPDMKEYILLQMLQLSENQGKPLDDVNKKDGTWTMVGMKNGLVAGGNFNDNYRQLNLNVNPSNYKVDNARLRRSVVVDV